MGPAKGRNATAGRGDDSGAAWFGGRRPRPDSTGPGDRRVEKVVAARIDERLGWEEEQARHGDGGLEQEEIDDNRLGLLPCGYRDYLAPLIKEPSPRPFLSHPAVPT